MRSTIRRALAALAVSGILAGGLVPTASADPDAVRKAQEQLAKIEAEASAMDARYIQLQAQLDDATTALATADKDLARQQTKVSTLSRNLGQFAMLRYQTSGVDVTTKLLTSDDEADFLNQLASIQRVTDRANKQVQRLQLAQADLAATRQTAATTRKKIAADKAEQATVAEAYHRKEAEAKAVLDKLTAEEKARLAEIERKKEAERKAKAEAAIKEAQERQRQAEQEEADREAERAAAEASAQAAASASASESASASATASEPSQPNKSTTTGGSSGRASGAVSYALGQVGKSYVMGATGPSSYDCSGLMLKAWNSAGVSLPRTSQDQYGAGKAVPTSELQPGDLVFYYSGITHVGMYLGKGMIVHAANPSSGVKVSSLNSMPLMGARRVG
ncbi:NlpC/P60 family protein [Luteococcus sp. H138]|uniref:C40 family peptidase n=1 Tax=unclassified Luteococcus TaxID=2639923 RepID=UPI00313D9BFF